MKKEKPLTFPPRIRAELLALLKMGKDNAITAADLSDELGLTGGITSETLRLGIIKPMIEEDHIPIGSCSKGYYLISCQTEYFEVYNDLEHRISGMKVRQKGLTRGFEKFKGKRPTYRQ